jgi:hypothetical protein
VSSVYCSGTFSVVVIQSRACRRNIVQLFFYKPICHILSTFNAITWQVPVVWALKPFDRCVACCDVFGLEPLTQNPRNKIMDLRLVNQFTPFRLPRSARPETWNWSCRRHWFGCPRSLKKVNQSRYRPELAQRLDRGIALPFLDPGARRRWMVSTTPRSLYPRERPGTPFAGGWVGPSADLDVCEKSRPHRDSIPGPSSP